MEVRASLGPQQAGRIPINALSSVHPIDVHVQSVRPDKATENRAVAILGGMKGLAPGQGPGCRAASEPPGQGAGVHFPGRR